VSLGEKPSDVSSPCSLAPHAWNLPSCLAAGDRPRPIATFYLFTPSSFARIIVRLVHSAMMGSL
jgi:hypothetical protein